MQDAGCIMDYGLCVTYIMSVHISYVSLRDLAGCRG